MTTEHDYFCRALSLAVHELRNPLGVVAGYLRMVIKEQAGPVSVRQRKLLEEASRACGRIDELVNQMSEFRKLEAREFSLMRQPFDLAALVAELASGMHGDDDRPVTFEVRGCERPLEVVGDRVRLGAAITALMRAAFRERSAGVIVAECSVVDASPRSALLAIGDEPTLAAVKAAGTDGPVFDEWRPGLGFALPIARRVIEAHGGALWSMPEHAKAASALRIPLKA